MICFIGEEFVQLRAGRLLQMIKWTITLTIVIMGLYSAGFVLRDLRGYLYMMGGHNDNVRALLRAFTENRPNALSQLLAEGVDANSTDEVGNTAIMYVALEGRADAVKTLISAGADVNVRGNDGSTPLMYAALSGSVETVRTLLEAGALVNIRNKAGLTALEVNSATPISFSLPFLKIRLTVKRRDSEVTKLLMRYATSSS